MEATNLDNAEQIEAVLLAINEENDPDVLNNLQDHLGALLERVEPMDLGDIN